MHRLIPSAIIPLLLSTLASTDHADNWGAKKSVTFDRLRANFANPDMIYAPFMFWFWDAPVDPAQAAEMAQKMCNVHMNPGYVHARRPMVDAPALPDEQWLSPLWFQALDGVLAKTEAAKSYFGFCDEYWWPGGRANGRVLKAHPELKAVSLQWQTFDLKAGESVDLPESFFTVAAQHVWPYERVVSQMQPEPPFGKWIWGNEGEKRVWFRKSFEWNYANVIYSALIKITAADEFQLYFNGKKIGQGDNWEDIAKYDIRRNIQTGKNVIAIAAKNKQGPAGLIAGLRVSIGPKPFSLGTDSDWLTTNQEIDGWQNVDLDDSAWTPATVVAEAGAEPWHLAQNVPHLKTRIKSNTLQIIGSGSPFTWTAPQDGSWRVYSFTKYFDTGIDGSEVNYLDNRLAPAYIPIALEPYAQHFGGKLGTSIPGAFMDHEGDYGYKLAWSDYLEKKYQEKTGCDIKLYMPLLMDDDAEGQDVKARWDWMDTVSDIYANDFFQKMKEWFVSHNLYYTEHVWEESLMWQATAVGDVFKVKRIAELPANDCLVHKALEVHDFKEVESVAEFEHRRFGSEILGVAGWDMSPVLMKQSLNSITAWGVGHIITHGLFMTRNLDGNPWPPDWYEENPFWRYLYQFNDYARRASYINSHGYRKVDTLLINPMDTIWTLTADGLFDRAFQGGVNQIDHWFGDEAKKIDQIYSEAINELTAARIEFLIADKYYIRQAKLDQGILKIDPFEFSAIVLPPMDILPLDVAEKIVQFAQQGGKVIVLSRLPDASIENGRSESKMKDLMATLKSQKNVIDCGIPIFKSPGSFPSDQPQLKPYFACLKSPVTFLSGNFPMLQQHRVIDGRDFFWLANNTEGKQKCRLAFAGQKGTVTQWDCETGKIDRYPALSADPMLIELTFKPYQAFWIVFNPSEEATIGEPPAKPEVLEKIKITGPWNVRLDPADQPPVPHKIPIPDIFADGKSVEKPLESWTKWGLEKFTGFIDYETEFDLTSLDGKFLLDLGKVLYMAEVWINGQKVGERLWPTYQFDSTPALHVGKNTVRIRVGNLMANNMGDPEESGLIGPVLLDRFPADGSLGH